MSRYRFIILILFLIHMNTIMAKVHKTSTEGFSSTDGYPKLTIPEPNGGEIELLPDNTYFTSSIQFTHSVHKVFSVMFEYNTCDDDGGPIWHSADGVALIVGKSSASYDSLFSLPYGNTLGAIKDGHGFSIQFKTYGLKRGIYIVDGSGDTLKKVVDQRTYTDCKNVSIDISVDQNGLLAVRKGTGQQKIEFTYSLSQELFNSLEGKQLAFSAATGAADSAHYIKVLRIDGLVDQERGPFAAIPHLDLTRVGTDNYVFQEFDNPLDQSGDILPSETLHIPGATFYRGALSTYDYSKVPVYVALVPSASIDRVLIQINGGTGTDPRYFMNNFNHKAVVMISMRGLHYNDIHEVECPLGVNLISCLKQVSYLKKVNPKDNGRDIVGLMRVILGEIGNFKVDNQPRDHSFFGVTNHTFNIETGSYGATLLGYALAEQNLPTIGRIFIEGPSSPSEHVISDGFRNTKVALTNLMNSLSMTETEKTSFIDTLKARHSAPREVCSLDLSQPITHDCLSSAMIFDYLKYRYEQIADEADRTSDTVVNNQLRELKDDLLAIPSSEATGGSELVAVKKIYSSYFLSPRVRSQTTWAKAKFDLLSANSPFNGFVAPGFTSRIGQICSAYISRHDGDSQNRFNTQRNKSENNPYWYGFLINYRDLLQICPQIETNLKTGITVPDSSSLSLNVEALVQYGAGTDEKHHEDDITEMASYISPNSLIRSVYRYDHIQGGSGPRYNDCFFNLRRALFESSDSSLSTTLDNIISNSCGLTSK